jgi:carbamoyl-phosphate synthase large subunit
MSIKLFIRQPFTETNEKESLIIQDVLDVVQGLNGKPYDLDFLTGLEAQTQHTFRYQFRRENGMKFTPKRFRRNRLQLIDEADVMMIVRTGLSESGAFEVAYNIFGGNHVPMFFAIWKGAPIRTTLLRELDDLTHVTYFTFENPDEIAAPFVDFIGNSRLATSDTRRCVSLPA